MNEFTPFPSRATRTPEATAVTRLQSDPNPPLLGLSAANMDNRLDPATISLSSYYKGRKSPLIIAAIANVVKGLSDDQRLEFHNACLVLNAALKHANRYKILNQDNVIAYFSALTNNQLTRDQIIQIIFLCVSKPNNHSQISDGLDRLLKKSEFLLYSKINNATELNDSGVPNYLLIEPFKRICFKMCDRIYYGLFTSLPYDLREADLSGLDLVGIKFGEAMLGNTNFSGSDVSECNFSGHNLTNNDLTDTDLTRANLANCTLDPQKLAGAKLIGANLNGIVISDNNIAALVDLIVVTPNDEDYHNWLLNLVITLISISNDVLATQVTQGIKAVIQQNNLQPNNFYLNTMTSQVKNILEQFGVNVSQDSIPQHINNLF